MITISCVPFFPANSQASVSLWTSLSTECLRQSLSNITVYTTLKTGLITQTQLANNLSSLGVHERCSGNERRNSNITATAIYVHLWHYVVYERGNGQVIGQSQQTCLCDQRLPLFPITADLEGVAYANNFALCSTSSFVHQTLSLMGIKGFCPNARKKRAIEDGFCLQEIINEIHGWLHWYQQLLLFQDE
jgi:hypothetical protein